VIYTYQEGSALAWWKQEEKSLKRFKNLSVIYLNTQGDIDALAKRTMTLQCNISDAELSLLDDEHSVSVTQERWK
jgi:uncharacterized protein YaeQ